MLPSQQTSLKSFLVSQALFPHLSLFSSTMPSQPPSPPLPKTALARVPRTSHSQIKWSLLGLHPTRLPEALGDSPSPFLPPKIHPPGNAPPPALAAPSHPLSWTLLLNPPLRLGYQGCFRIRWLHLTSLTLGFILQLIMCYSLISSILSNYKIMHFFLPMAS